MDHATQRRIEQLEAEVAKLLRIVQEFPARVADVPRRREVRLAVTAVLDGESSYPPSNANTFGIIFVDVTYTPNESGFLTPMPTMRQQKALTTAQSTDGSFVAQGTTVIVAIDNGRWWIVRGAGATTSAACGIIGDTPLVQFPHHKASPNDFVVMVEAATGCVYLNTVNPNCAQTLPTSPVVG